LIYHYQLGILVIKFVLLTTDYPLLYIDWHSPVINQNRQVNLAFKSL